jgi:hypothetical protein
MEADFDPNKLLPNGIIIDSAGTHLYGIGLSLFPYNLTKRSKFHNPLFIFIVNYEVLIRCTISLIMSDKYAKTLPYYRDIAHSLNARIHYNISGILIIILVLFSQMIHYYNRILFLFMIWISFATIISTILYLTFFLNSNLIIKMIFIYGSFLFVCILMSIISTASSVDFEANKSYKLLYSCLNKFGKRNLSKRSRIVVFGKKFICFIFLFNF